MTETGLLLSRDLRTFKRLGRMTYSGIDDRDVILFPETVNGKYITLHRPMQWCGSGYDCAYPSIWISVSDTLLEPGKMKLLAKNILPWECKIGGSTPPLKTGQGWLMLYHSVGRDLIYRVGVMMLDLHDPTRVIARASDFIMEPEYDYETSGFYNGCVFPSGNVVVDGKLYVYYGAGDRVCCVATCPLDDLIRYVMAYNSNGKCRA
ncbi:unnamed protein product [marine sediment metagenome]|uniref:Glycosidase n=1 Tax=marine sediment metagenome TaxID=412755 RepID=X1JPV8_9ZZZZ